MEFDRRGIWVAVGVFFIGVFMFAHFMGALFVTKTESSDTLAITQAVLLNFAMLFTIFVLLAFKL